MTQHFQSKPRKIEAIQWDGTHDGVKTVVEWAVDRLPQGKLVTIMGIPENLNINKYASLNQRYDFSTERFESLLFLSERFMSYPREAMQPGDYLVHHNGFNFGVIEEWQFCTMSEHKLREIYEEVTDAS